MTNQDPAASMVERAERAVRRALPDKGHTTAAHGLHFADGTTPTLLAHGAALSRSSDASYVADADVWRG